MNAEKTKKSFSSRLSKNSQQGLDGMNLQYALSIEGAERLCLPGKPMYNDNGKTIAEISCVGGKLSAYVNAVHCIRPNNLKPLTVTEAIKLEMIKSEVIGFMQDYLKEHLQGQDSEGYVDNLMVKELECNLTLACVNGAIKSGVVGCKAVLALIQYPAYADMVNERQKAKAVDGSKSDAQKAFEHAMGLTQREYAKQCAELYHEGARLRRLNKRVDSFMMSVREDEANAANVTCPSFWGGDDVAGVMRMQA